MTYRLFAFLLGCLGCSACSQGGETPQGDDASTRMDGASYLADAEADVSQAASDRYAPGPDGTAPGPDRSVPGSEGGIASLDGADDAANAVPDGSTDAAADAAAPYNPCPPKGTACRIMPLGDSITYGASSTTLGGYRAALFQKAINGQQTIAFVGSQSSGPATVGGVPFPRANEGHSGYTIDSGGGRQGIQPLVQNALQTYRPHIVTLMIGTNDVDIQLDLVNAPMRLGTLIDTILAADPALLVVVATITPTQNDNENTRDVAYNTAIPGLVAARAQQGKHVVMVDMYAAFTANPNYKTQYLANTLHPNDAGFVVMGDVWYAAIGRLFR